MTSLRKPFARTLLSSLLCLAIIGLGCGEDSVTSTCGNGFCELRESADSCPTDCRENGFCGDQFCADTETVATCPDDCLNCTGIRRASDTGQSCAESVECSPDAVCANLGAGRGRRCVQPCIPAQCEAFCATGTYCGRTTDGVSGLCVPECSTGEANECGLDTVCATRDGASRCVPADNVLFTAEAIRAGIDSRYFDGSDWDLFSGPDPEVVFSLSGLEICTTGPAFDTAVATYSSSCSLPLRVGDELDVVLYESDDLDGSDFVIGCRLSIASHAILRQIITDRRIRCADTGSPPSYPPATTWIEFDLIAR